MLPPLMASWTVCAHHGNSRELSSTGNAWPLEAVYLGLPDMYQCVWSPLCGALNSSWYQRPKSLIGSVWSWSFGWVIASDLSMLLYSSWFQHELQLRASSDTGHELWLKTERTRSQARLTLRERERSSDIQEGLGVLSLCSMTDHWARKWAVATRNVSTHI